MLPAFTSDTRLFELSWHASGPPVLVEAWWGREALSQGFELCVDVLSTDAHIALKRFLGRAVTLWSVLPDGHRQGRSALVRAAFALGADGGFGRYRLVLVPWVWCLTQTRNNRVFQDKRVEQIVEQVFAGYHDVAAWQWGEEVEAFLARVRPRSYCVQYGETDYAFVSRLLAEEGIGWCVEEDEAAPAGHRMRLFADSARFAEDVQSAAGDIRFHRADSQEDSDAIVALGAHRRLGVGVGATLSYDYKAKAAVAASLPSRQRPGGPNAPVLEDYDDAGLYAYADRTEAEHYAALGLEAREARFKHFVGRGSVRSFRPGHAFTLAESPLDALIASPEDATDAAATRFALRETLHVGINNLSGEAMAAVARRLSASQRTEAWEYTEPTPDIAHAPRILDAAVLALAEQRGYANRFEAQRLSVPWRAVLEDGTGARLNPRPTAPGPMSAIVVGPRGEAHPSGADELYCDRYGRIKVRFHWQEGREADDQLTCWLRVASRQAGAGMGWHSLPRIGQEVLVGFMNDDIDRPVVIGALYNGRGEGGIRPTPGGDTSGEADRSAADAIFDQATDHSPSGQGNLAAGNSPAWHGGAADSHGHPAALTGIKTKEFGAHGRFAGHNQLVFDDTDEQQRIQLKSTESASEFNLGHLIHQADNYRGSFRGTGIELRTDAWGALRAGSGLLMSTWAKGSPSEPAGDNSAGMALLRQAGTLARTLSNAARTHQTVQLASAIGTSGAGRSHIDPDAAPIDALHTVASGMVDSTRFDTARADAADKRTATGPNAVPHLLEPAIVQAARAGLAMVAGQHLQWTVGETATVMSGQDTNLAVAGKTRIHTGQAIGLLAGAISAGDQNTGIQLIAAKGDIDLQAQSDAMKFQAKQDLKLVSASANIDFAAAKKVVLSVGGGASITIDGGITVQCPGTITVHASAKSFSGPTSLSYDAPAFMPPDGFHAQPVLSWEGMDAPVVNRRFRATLEDGRVVEGRTDAHGRAAIAETAGFQHASVEILPDDD
ncbi:type VI secretion system tip protein VgrG [Nitrogeniibacter mangrovi]|uniref:Type VI secretion system tip protein VgrG n=1 Tax=Nitrogeniibacter mangrovi TaxID=2016596 RepID=A0A6C1B1N3_9RHOO|nr:type VI secretion system tip protein VgrG [Nitrogeniibacter mangrovi]QID16260.1 type VI secretion system tip protein VgrG [Nitrogeniibacter mangrovi]